MITRSVLSRCFCFGLMLWLLFFQFSMPCFAQVVKGEGRLIPEQYIVTLKRVKKASNHPSVAEVASDLALSYGAMGAEIVSIYENALKGFAVRMDEKAVENLSRDSRVLRVEQDAIARTADVQNDPGWGLDRVDQRELPLDKAYTTHESTENVHVYIIDTGVRVTHQEFSGRIGSGYDAVKDGNGIGDCNGHGTHVAGVVAGSVHGVAKGVTIHSVRVLNCDGSAPWSTVIEGIDWITGHASKPAVANMSIGGSFSPSVNDAVQTSVRSGITYAIAAGNGGKDACAFSPSSVRAAITTAASDVTDVRSTWSPERSSNFGSCVDIFAPGSHILSASHLNDIGTVRMGGTSMATPHVAGAAALYLGGHPKARPIDVKKAILESATADRITDIKGSPNRLLYTLFDVKQTPVPDPDIQADFSHISRKRVVDFQDKSRAIETSLTSWQWDFGDGMVSMEQNPTYSYEKAGKYEVTLTITDGKLEEQKTKTVTIRDDVAYCLSSSANQNYEWISKVRIGEFSHTSGATGYSDFTSKGVTLYTGRDHKMTLTPGFKGGSHIESWKAWIDYNGNGRFDDKGEAIFAMSGKTEVADHFKVPASAKGTTRMRISMRHHTIPLPCGDFDHGEVEDYTVLFNDGPPPKIPPVAEFSTKTRRVAKGEVVYFKDESTNDPTVWEWTFENGLPNKSKVQNSRTSYRKTGKFSVTLKAKNKDGVDIETKLAFIEVFEDLQKCAPAFQTYRFYHKGDQVSYNGRNWETRWWSILNPPQNSGFWNVWSPLGACKE